ncbi:ribbon-helix-helix protein, CopG family [Aquisalimonas sp. 2447]|uniref:CopG family ribbon-helix-helix protein n=1 Tax=Aquisalimonas sp. 2447 TaxID=2740807 RepID=UPI001432530C|nr:CopG family ribbon-helix-helix protein [Aquisalimonas sp. 2447]QIT56593.1 ribbon-helix-helix protein, CopG family [Aquisalimonas sp. 2447]
MATPTSIKLDEELKDRVQRLANSRERSAHWLMRAAIEEYVDREERREAFKREALEAWETYQATGLHVTSDEMRKWLASWGTEDELPAPKCHE